MFERSKETDRIVNHLRAFEKGAQIPYAAFSQAVGFEVTARTGKLYTALLILKREHGQVWHRVRPNVGVRRLDDREIAERLPGWWIKTARSKMRRAEPEIKAVDTHALNIDEQTRFAANCFQREVTMLSLSRATRTRIETVARGPAGSNQLPTFNILEWAITLTPTKRGVTV